MKKLLLLLLFIPLVGFGQGILKGYTIDFAEFPLPGASIYNTTNKKSSISNKVGYFIINASVGDIIKVSYVGFTTQTFKVENFEVLVQLSADKQLEDIVKAELKNKKSKEKETEIPFASIEDVPLFPGCEKVRKSKRRECFQNKMNRHIRRNFRYPEIAQEMGIQGRVFVMFTIGSDGSIINIRTRGPHSILEREANRIISLLPKMTPGTQKGRPVRVPFSIPIQFILR
jgi:TonB family protein